jgi:hypothetical protein
MKRIPNLLVAPFLALSCTQVCKGKRLRPPLSNYSLLPVIPIPRFARTALHRIR